MKNHKYDVAFHIKTGEPLPIPDDAETQALMALQLITNGEYTTEERLQYVEYALGFNDALALQVLLHHVNKDKSLAHSPAVLTWILDHQPLLTRTSRWVAHHMEN